ncbi:Glutathione gamma-glutamylcysteinyltransferase 1, partial [Ancistrocladus abbreviatus]
MASFFYLVLLVTLFSSAVLSVQSKNSSSSSIPSIVLSLRAQKIQSGSNARPADRLAFHHNVSLTVTLSVGTPPQPVSMVLDTGSELSWLHCKKSLNVNSFFDPNRSKSYSSIPCNSPTCRTRTRDLTVPVSCDSKKLCHASIAYADATSMEGTLALETFRIGSSPVPGVVFGCMDTGFSSSTEEDSKTTGLLGMNRGSLSFVTQMGYPKFSYCISGQDSSGVLVLGEASTPWLKPLRYTPLVQISTPLPYFDRVAYSVHLEGIKVGAKLLPLSKSILEPDHTGAGQTMVDSGTQFTFLLGPVYTILRDEFKAQTKGVLKPLDDPNYVYQGAMDSCFLIPLTQKTLPTLPTVTLIFQDAEMTVSTEQLLYRVPDGLRGSNSIHCFTFGNSDLLGIEAYVIGHHHQQNIWMEFDLAQSRVGLAEHGLAEACLMFDQQWQDQIDGPLGLVKTTREVSPTERTPLFDSWVAGPIAAQSRRDLSW